MPRVRLDRSSRGVSVCAGPSPAAIVYKGYCEAGSTVEQFFLQRVEAVHYSITADRPMPKTRDYDTRRALVRDRIKTHPRASLTELAEKIERNYKYVTDVLRGDPGKRSEPVVSAAEDYVNSL